MVRPLLVVLVVSILVTCIQESIAQNDNECGKNEVWDNCGTACPAKCSTKPSKKRTACPMVCRQGCRCKAGFLRRDDGACVRRAQCAVNKAQ
ncbi:chymotrypsin inhibitor [Venturia canescens]|uniref:chymotrypsin inhibitor n=1 Tax=Venturia canescens TaxID=32260 RepID=UPI001C9C2476|nr:chymotrypsin inhibitor [Venturia canescens]